MAPSASKVFSAKHMTDVLKEIDEKVRLIVYCTREQGAKVQQEVGSLLQKYLKLLSKVLGQCKDLKNFTKMSQGILEGNEEILHLVLNGSVQEFLEDIRMQHYLPNFESKDLRSASQLLKSNFDIEKVALPVESAKEEIQDKIADLRKDLSTIKDRLQEVKVQGKECCESSKEITENFDTFTDEIKNTLEEIDRVLSWHRSKEGAVCVAAFTAIGLAILLLATCTGGAVACVCAKFGVADIVVPVGATEALVGCGIGGGVAGAAGYGIHQLKKEMEKIGQALEKLQGQLNEMTLEASKQKTAWEEINIQAGSVMKHIDNTVEGNADHPEPSSKQPLKRLLNGIQSVRAEVVDLWADVMQFEGDAKRTLGNLQRLSLIKKHDVVPADLSSPLQNVHKIAEGLLKTTKTERGHDVTMCTEHITASLIAG
ncbi:uncharacterized protein LOC118410390 [Branchiostoma floridae]|uniref:Uncharacterized protein LOC118410390 n=1 Tax=Branchiostoma floridae TaxID=7739 RepID=A0A9J7KPU5_BRAFL|nr:uncharacterized protein LOC118410390 [Branchiostoma floridae]